MSDNVARKPNGSNSDADSNDWDEIRLEEGLAHLKLLHLKARMLRQAVPKITEPLETLETKQSTPDVIFQKFVQSVNEVKGNVSAFTELMQDAKSKAVLERAEKSRADKPTGIKPWKHQDHADWYNLDEDIAK